MTQTPVEVSDELFGELAKRFDEREMVELTATIAWENWRARFNRSFQIEAHGFSEGSYCPMPERGGD